MIGKELLALATAPDQENEEAVWALYRMWSGGLLNCNAVLRYGHKYLNELATFLPIFLFVTIRQALKQASDPKKYSRL